MARVGDQCNKAFNGFDISNFWHDSEYARKEYVSEPLSDDLISSVEAELDVRLPASYLELMKTQNGGIPRNTCFPTKTPTYFAKDHVGITGILGVGRRQTYSLCGPLGSEFMRTRWRYPAWGISVCNCPSAGHDMIMLDYRKCGRDGEPEVVHVCQETGHMVTFLATDFEAFVRGLVHESVYDLSKDRFENDVKNVESGRFSSILGRLIANSGEPAYGIRLRNLCQKLTNEKRAFVLHADELSVLVYDLLFYLYTLSEKVTDMEQYLKVFPRVILIGDGEFGTRGYGPGFVKKWINDRLSQGAIVAAPSGELVFSEAFLNEFNRKLNEFG
jgi:hypothetical protein